MHDARTLIDMGQGAVDALARRGFTLDLEHLSYLSAARSTAIGELELYRNKSRRLAEQSALAARAGGPTDELREQARTVKDHIRDLELARAQAETDLTAMLQGIPNLPAGDVPDGADEASNVVVAEVGAPTPLPFPAKDHVAIAEAMGILDFGRAAKLSGARFSVARGAGAVLERALASFFLTMHTSRHGYEEVSVPALVNRATMTGTGQLPKFEDDLFKTSVGDRELFLIPTAEVPVTNLHAGEVLPAADLPLAYTSWTPCFRSEAGAHGRDTRGLLRLHQFSKVELVRLVDPATSRDELELMVRHASACLTALGLTYRVVQLATGDLGFSAAVTYDLEVWMPGHGAYREISSCSDTGTFQARRAGIRFKGAGGGKPGFVATLNGSGLPIGRTMAALLEQHQQADGSVVIPEPLVPFTGFRSISADGTPQH